MYKFRTLKAHEIDVRVQSCKETGCSLLLYKDARVDQNILDESVGCMNWQREHTRDNANCIVSIWDESKKQWIKKEDTGTESMTEKAKGLASDSFKRACFNWGIGRELYSSPFIWINLLKEETRKNGNKVQLNLKVKFTVKEIEYDENRNIIKLSIQDQTGKIRYELGKHIKQDKPKKEDDPEGLEEVLKKAVSAILGFAKKNNIDAKEVYDESKARFNTTYLKTLNQDQLKELHDWLVKSVKK